MVRKPKPKSDNKIPTWAIRAAQRMAQVAQQPGRYRFEVQAYADGRRDLAVIPEPEKIEKLGRERK